MEIKNILIGILCALVIYSAYMSTQNYRRYHALKAYNMAVTRNDLAAAGAITLPAGRFAKAFQHHQSGDFQAARLIYDELLTSEQAMLSRDARYNQANTFLQQALAAEVKDQADLTMPLIELAKIAYRELLIVHPEHRGAKYNLEIALQLSPDDRALPPVEIPGRRDPNRTIISIDPEDSLP